MSKQSDSTKPMGIAFVGCGFVADLYAQTLPSHKDLTLIGVMDKDARRAERFGKHYGVPVFGSMEELLSNPQVELVVNLTNPHAHEGVTRASLEHGKHVYSEKPLAMGLEQARSLVALARSRGLRLSGAPCTLLGAAAQRAWRAVRENRVGRVRLVYAELDDGRVDLAPHRKWVSASGAPWPAEDEFSVGCTLEHAGYVLTWLVAMFGPVSRVTSFAGLQVHAEAPDFTVACLEFRGGVVARLTCSVLAPHDHTLRVMGDEGVLFVKDTWSFHSPVYVRKWMRLRRRLLLSPIRHRVPGTGSPAAAPRRGSARIDFSLGVAALARAICGDGDTPLNEDFCLHVNEVVLAIQNARDLKQPYEVTTTIPPMERNAS